MKLTSLQSTIILDTLVQIAAFGDKRAEEWLRIMNSYSRFVEPRAVRAAREALNKIGYVHDKQ